MTSQRTSGAWWTVIDMAHVQHNPEVDKCDVTIFLFFPWFSTTRLGRSFFLIAMHYVRKDDAQRDFRSTATRTKVTWTRNGFGYVHIPSNYGTIKVSLNLVQLAGGIFPAIDPAREFPAIMDERGRWLPVIHCDEADFYRRWILPSD